MLNSCLVHDMEKYLLEEIYHERAELIFDQMCGSMGDIQELYVWYHQFGELHAFTEACEDAHEFENKYLKDIEEAYPAAVRIYVKYRNALNLSAKRSKHRLLEVEVKNLKKNIKAKLLAAKEVVKSSDEDKRKTAKTVKSKLKASHKSYDYKFTEYQKLKLKLSDYIILSLVM